MVFGRFGAKQKKQGKYWQPCRDVTTSRRHHDLCASIIKSKGRPNFEGIKERADWREENRAVVTGIIGFLYFLFSDKLRMIDRLIMCIFNSSMF